MTKDALLVLILDRSGSMEHLRDDVIGGVNAFLDEQRRIEGNCRLTLAQFDTVYEVVYHNVPLNEVRPLDRSNYLPRGGTALLDGIGRTLSNIEADLAKLPADQQPKVYVVINTDGDENSSQEFKGEAGKARIFQMISDRRNQGWEFIFMGANQDAIKAGESLSISASNSINYTSDSCSTRGSYGTVSNNIANSRMTGESIGFTDQDRKRALGKPFIQ